MSYFKTPYSKQGFFATPYNGLTSVAGSGGSGYGQRQPIGQPAADLEARIQRRLNSQRAAQIIAALEADDDE